MTSDEIPKEIVDSVRSRAQLCFGCGVCMGGCPVARVNEKFHPRRLIRDLVFGSFMEVLRGETIWLCAQCHICSETCPQGVGISEIIVNLRNLATDIGVSPPESYIDNIKQVAETGRTVPVSSRVERLRNRLGLDKLGPAAAEEIRALVRDTKFEELIVDKEGA